MGVVANLVVRVSASITDFEKQMAGLERQLGKTGDRLQSIGGDLTKGLTLPLAGIAVAAYKLSSDFDTAMTKVRTLASESAENVAELRKQVLQLAPAVGIGPTQLADALLAIESTGFRGSQAMSILEMAAKGSAIGMGASVDVARALTAAVNAYGVENLSAAKAADILTATVDAGGAEADELATEIGRVVGVASQLGVSFEQVGAFIATYTKLGLNASEATTGLSGVLNMILNPSKEARQALSDLGTSADGLRIAVKEHGLNEALIELLNRAKGNGDAIGALFGNVRALAGVMGTAGSQAKTYRDVLEQISNSTNTLNKRFDIWRTTTAATWKEFTAQVQVAGIQLGDKLAPSFSKVLQAAGPVLDKIISLIQWFGSLPQGVQTATLGFLAFAAAIGPVVYAIGTLASTAGSLIGLFRMMSGTATAAGTSAGGAAVGVGALSTAMGVLAQAAAVVGVAIGSWKLGRWIGDLSGLTDWIGRLSARFGEFVGFLPQGTAAQYAATQAAREQAAAVKELHDQLGLTFRTTDIELPSEKKPPAGKGGPILGPGGMGEMSEEAKKYAQELKALSERLSGRDVIDGAQQWVLAIAKIGGIGKLTHDELKQFTDDITKAVEKMQLMGEVVPRTWQAIANATKTDTLLESSRDMLGKSLQNAGINGPQDLNRQQLVLPSREIDTAALMNAIPAAVQNQNISGQIAAAAKQAASTWGGQFKTGVSSALGDLGNVIMGALQGGGNVAASVGGLFGGQITEGISGHLTKQLSGMFGKTLGGALGSVIPGLGTMLGSMIGPLIANVGKKIWHGIQGMFGTDEEARDVNPSRDSFLAEFGDVGNKDVGGAQWNLANKLTQITGESGGGHLMDAFLKADTMEKFNAAKSAVEEALKKGDAAGKQAADSIESASDAASGLTMNVSGSDEAIKALGETQDRVVNAMLAGFDKLIAKMQEFIGGMSNAGAALGATAAPAPATPGLPLDEVVTPEGVVTGEQDPTSSGFWNPNAAKLDPNNPGYYTDGSPVGGIADGTIDPNTGEYLPGFATGTGGQYLDFGSGTPVMLHGRERVMTEKEAQGGNLQITIGQITVGGGTDAAEVRRATAMGVLDAIEQGGVVWQKFRILSGQAVPA